MGNVVGPKGQIVIEKSIRDELGVRPGWRALQRVVDGCVEIRFVPPDHNHSLAGCLAPYVKKSVPEEAYAAAKQSAWEEAARRKHVRSHGDERDAGGEE